MCVILAVSMIPGSLAFVFFVARQPDEPPYRPVAGMTIYRRVL